jgi:hypothetical protein
MSKKKIGLIVVVCALVGASVFGAQVIEAFKRQYLNTGLFSVAAHETAFFYVSLDDQKGEPPAHIVMQFFNASGVEIGRTEVDLEAGQSVRLVRPGPGLFRAHAEVTDTTLQLTARRAGVGAVEVIDTITGGVRHIPTYNPHQIQD